MGYSFHWLVFYDVTPCNCEKIHILLVSEKCCHVGVTWFTNWSLANDEKQLFAVSSCIITYTCRIITRCHNTV